MAAFNAHDTVVAFAYGANVHGPPQSLRLWDIANRRPLGPPLKTQVVDLALNGNTLATADGVDGTVRLWDVANGRPLGPPLRYGPGRGAVRHLAFSPDGTTLAAAALAPDALSGHVGTVRLWDVATRRALGLPLTGDGTEVFDLAFDHDGSTLAAAGSDGTVQLWDVHTRRALGSALPVGGAATVAFSPDGRALAASSIDNANTAKPMLRFWDLAARRPLGESHLINASNLAFSPDGTTLATGGDHDRAWLWDSTLWGNDWRRLHDRVCTTLTRRNLTRAEWREFLAGTPYHHTCG
jgi:WD40 repeat protein